MAIPTPVKPFASYKWHWASHTPSEGLNEPPVYLGVLRAWAAHNGQTPSDPSIITDLTLVQNDTKTGVNLVRTGDRNLKRNSGQYWASLGLLDNTYGIIDVTTFGQDVAKGKITPTEFAAVTIKTLTLPNRRIQSDTIHWDQWDQAGLSIKPLQLILQIMEALGDAHGLAQAKLTPEELVKIVIPMAGAKSTLADYVEALHRRRQGLLSLSDWPDCAPAANDKRIAREFLLFLANYGFCEKEARQTGQTRDTEIYRLTMVGGASSITVNDLIKLPASNNLITVANQVQNTDYLADIDRHRVQASILARPQQAKFRRQVLAACDGKCLLTGVGLKEALEAAHIKPIRDGGNDHVSNGICLRSDIHALFDTGHLRVEANGQLHLSQAAAQHTSYSSLPPTLSLPDYVSLTQVDWRWKYK